MTCAVMHLFEAQRQVGLLIQWTGCLPGIEERCFVDIDSLLHPVDGHANRRNTPVAGIVVRSGLIMSESAA